MQKIMFNDRYGLTKAVLDGRKTATRRPVPEKLLEAYYDYDDYVNAVAPRDIPYSREYEEEFFLRRSPFKVGEVVAVAQSYKDAGLDPKKCDNFQLVVYGDFPPRHNHGWGNKMFVKADLMPHQIRITNVRVERLQDISDEDCIREGIGKSDVDCITPFFIPNIDYEGYLTARHAFKALINWLAGKGTWASNPWVFVYEFELVK